MSRTQRITTTLFWIAFGVFLSVSVPHLAWVVHSYEPQQTDGWNIVWWPLSYGFALAIDAVVCWLSYVKSTGEKAGDTWVAWVFIVALVLMSWYFNLIYAQAHDPSRPGIDIWTTSLFGLINIGTLTPIIVSALPVFIIAYAYMHGKIANAKPKAPKTLEELQQEANEAEQKAAALIAIQQANTEVKKASAQSQKELVKAYFAWGKREQNEKPNEPKIDTPLPESKSIENHSQAEEHPENGTPIVMETEYQEEQVQVESEVADVQEDTAQHHAISGVTISFEDAASLTGYSVGTLKKYASQGKVKRSKRDENLLLLSSLAGMRNKLKPLQTDKFPVVELMNGNNHH